MISPVAADIGEDFARAVAAKDAARVRELLHPELDFRGMTPNRIWEATDPQGVVDVLNLWFEPSDEIERIDVVETDSFADRQRVGYRLRVRNGDGLHLVEQQVYFSEEDGKIRWMRVMCSGVRPVE